MTANLERNQPKSSGDAGATTGDHAVPAAAGAESHCSTSADPLAFAASTDGAPRAELPSSSNIPMQTIPAARSAHPDSRVHAAWCEWLDALGTDAEAALAAAMAYKELEPAARDTWLSALEQDTPQLKVPRIAVYAPLLAVEADPDRRARITAGIGPADVRVTPATSAFALCGSGKGRSRIAAIVLPLYLDFVQVLACGYTVEEGFDWVRHDPIVLRRAVPKAGDHLEGVRLENAPMKPLIDELALAVLAHARRGRPIPEALRAFADLFGPGDVGDLPPQSK